MPELGRTMIDKQGLELTFMWYLKNIKYFNSLNKKNIIRRMGKFS